MIRAITLGDAREVSALIRAAFSALEASLDPPPSALQVTPEDILVHLQKGGGALAPEQGCILWTEREGGLYISRLAVRPGSRGRGLGRTLLSGAEQAALSKGLPRLHLEVRLVLAGNRRLFSRAGFVETHLRSHPGYTRPTYVEAEKWLDAQPG